ncbi:MAG: DUF308 domain-containing protein [Oscillospiraceae bacterium]|nr:DUF308 domain-containing protein [Oscillospiraceae bacterium]
MKFAKITTIIIGVLMIISGLVCLFSPGLTYLGLAYAIGIGMIMDAVGRIVTWWKYRKVGLFDGWMLVGAILSLVFGIILIGDAALQVSVGVFIAYMAAIWILIHGIIHIVRAVKIHRFHKDWDTVVIGKHWWVLLLFGIVTVLFGVLSVMNPAIIMTAVGTFIGLGIIAAGANMVTVALSLRV